MRSSTDYTDWHIPLNRGGLTLAEAQASLQTVGAQAQQVPLMVRLVENPKFKLPGITLFHGAVDLESHDCIHILLGRGLLPADEAFTIGFTMGSTGKVHDQEAGLFALVSKHLYPKTYKFRDRELVIFRDALRLAMVSHCCALDDVAFARYRAQPLKRIRDQLGIDVDLLSAYYRIEQHLFPDSKASQRLLKD